MLPEGGPVAVKVCGLTTPEDAAACARHGLWGIGVVFAEGSPRRVDAATAARVLAAVPDGVARVGVFVGAAPGAHGGAGAGGGPDPPAGARRLRSGRGAARLAACR